MTSLSSLPVLVAAGANAALVTFVIYTMVVFALAAFSNRLLQSKSFLSEYFLGSRSLGVWAFALTFAATSSSGGSFTGFPSRIYQHGWVLALWIGSYMVVPICAMGLIGKRLNHVARVAGAITVPDVLRDRFRSPRFGLLAVLLIVFFMTVNLIAQFKAGTVILQILLNDVKVFQDFAVGLNEKVGFGFEDPQYVVCLFGFGIAVILYTTYGGFHAVVWTDVMQGVVMVVGVIIMLPLALVQVGGLPKATEAMKNMVPPIPAVAVLDIADMPPTAENAAEYGKLLNSWFWITEKTGDVQGSLVGEKRRLIKIVKRLRDGDDADVVNKFQCLEIVTPGDIQTVATAEDFQPRTDLSVVSIEGTPYKSGHGQKGVYVSGPGPDRAAVSGFLPLSLAVSFFFMWAISGTGQPSNMVRLMAFNSSLTLRRSIFTVAIYYTMIYFPLVIIFCAARVLMPGMDLQSDKIMPAMAVFLTENIAMGWLAGLLVAAPFAAVMSTVDSFLLMISSALVRDVYQRNFRPDASEKTLKRLSYMVTLLVGAGGVLGALNPPDFLQDIIVYCGSGLAACFLAPVVFGLYWPRVNAAGCVSGMMAGFLSHLSMYVIGFFVHGGFTPYRLLNFDPIIVGLAVSFIAVPLVSMLTEPPPADLVRKYFYKK